MSWAVSKPITEHTSLILHYILLHADHDTLSGNIPLVCLDRKTTSQFSLGVTAKSLKDSHHYSWETILLKLEREKIGNHTLSVRSIHAFRHAFLHDINIVQLALHKWWMLGGGGLFSPSLELLLLLCYNFWAEQLGLGKLCC